MYTTEYPTLSVTPLSISGTVSIIQVFEQFANDNWAILLDSANSAHQDARFDIIVANPIATVVTEQACTTATHVSSGEQVESKGEPLDVIKQLMAEYLPDNGVNLASLTNPEQRLPFLAGAMGYFGYDLGRQFETLPKAKQGQYKTPDMSVGIYTWSIIKDNLEQRFYLCSLTPYPIPDISALYAHITEDLDTVNAEYSTDSFSLSSDWSANMSQDQYRQKIAHVHDYLKSGDCYQINLAQRFSANYEGCEWQAYKKLTKANQAPFSAFIRLPNTAILSISPERFLAVKNNQVQTKPIKGTQPRNANKQQDQQNMQALLDSEKDRAENLMIVDLLRNDLSKHCLPNTVTVPELFKIESFNAVHHLVSTVTGELKPSSSALDLFQGAFPGGSITGAPKIRAMEIIDELEPDNRNIYCGSIGYFGITGDMDTSICIRTLLCEKSSNEQQTKNNVIYCWAGGGIVIDSKAELEYQESLDKISKILPTLAQC